MSFLGYVISVAALDQHTKLTCSSRRLPTLLAIPGALVSTRVMDQRLPRPSLVPQDQLHRPHRPVLHLAHHLAPLLARTNALLMGRLVVVLPQQRARRRVGSPPQALARRIQMTFRSVQASLDKRFCDSKRLIP